MGTFSLQSDPKFPSAVTLFTPGRQKIRIHEYPNGDLRFRISNATPIVIREAYLTGNSKDAIITLSPGWTDDQKSKFEGAVGETVLNSRRLQRLAPDMLSALTASIYHLEQCKDENRSDKERADSEKALEGFLETVRVACEAMDFLGTLRIQVPNIAYDLRRLGQMSLIQNIFSEAVRAWNGENHAKKSMAELTNEFSAKLGKPPSKLPKPLFDRWGYLKNMLPTLNLKLIDAQNEIMRRDVP